MYCPKRNLGLTPDDLMTPHILAYLEVRVLQVFVRLPPLKLVYGVPARHGLPEGRQPLLAALQTLRPLHHVPERPQLRELRKLVLVLQPHGAAVEVAEGLAVPQQPVEPQGHLHVLHRLLPLLPGVLVQRVFVRGLQRHQLVPGEAPEAVFLILGVHS